MAESVWPTQRKARLLCIVNGAAMTAARHERKNLKGEAAFSSAQKVHLILRAEPCDEVGACGAC